MSFDGWVIANARVASKPHRGIRLDDKMSFFQRPQIPREWYSEVVLWNYGDDRAERYAAGCLRWGTHTRTWYDICRAQRRAVVSVRY